MMASTHNYLCRPRRVGLFPRRCRGLSSASDLPTRSERREGRRSWSFHKLKLKSDSQQVSLLFMLSCTSSDATLFNVAGRRLETCSCEDGKSERMQGPSFATEVSTSALEGPSFCTFYVLKREARMLLPTGVSSEAGLLARVCV